MDNTDSKILYVAHAKDGGDSQIASTEDYTTSSPLEVDSINPPDVQLPTDLHHDFYMKGAANFEPGDDESSLCSDDIYAVDPMCARLKRFLESKNNEPMIDILTDIRDQLVLLNKNFNKKEED